MRNEWIDLISPPTEPQSAKQWLIVQWVEAHDGSAASHEQS
jgi:hypothetical protein